MFEQIVMATIVKLGRPTDWALPYWNYSPNDSKARIPPPAFRELKLPDGSANMLRITERSAGVNTGTPYGPVIQLALRRAKQRRGHLVTSIVAASKDSHLVASTRQ